jgi:Fe-S-cluster containining protein
MILPEERGLFDDKIIRPNVGFSNDFMFGPSQIAYYQLAIDNCPHLSSRNTCSIYERRPLVCRTYPYMIQYPQSIKPYIS